jgi:transcriptional regulator with XRE-family HTH domain
MTASSPESPLRHVLAENVRVLRTGLGVSQEDLAVKAGFHRTYVSQIEREKVNLTLDNLAKLADALKVAPAKLLSPPKTKK